MKGLITTVLRVAVIIEKVKNAFWWNFLNNIAENVPVPPANFTLLKILIDSVELGLHVGFI